MLPFGPHLPYFLKPWPRLKSVLGLGLQLLLNFLSLFWFTGSSWFSSDELPPASLAIAYRCWSCWVICPRGNPESDYWRDSLEVLEMCGIIESDLPFALVFSLIRGTVGQTSQFEGVHAWVSMSQGVWLHCLTHFLLESTMRNLSSKLVF